MTYRILCRSFSSHDAALLVSHFTGHPFSWCLLHRDEEFSFPDGLIARHEAGVPLQYLIGEAFFCGERFLVTPDCLIPQPDTEVLVEHAAHFLPEDGFFLDFCTGSGCIALSLLLKRKKTSAAAVDISRKALDVAEKNAELHQLSDRVSFLECDLLAGKFDTSLLAKCDLLVSNPPYIRRDVIPTLSEEVRHEPLLALDGGDDGLLFYRVFLQAYLPCLREGVPALFEIGFDQAEAVSALCREYGYFYKIFRDFGGNDRVIAITRGKNTLGE